MPYRPQALDTDKIAAMFEESFRFATRQRTAEMAKVEAYWNGYEKALSSAEDCTRCSNYETRLPPTAVEALAAVCREFEVPTEGIIDAGLCCADAAVVLAGRIRETMSREVDHD